MCSPHHLTRGPHVFNPLARSSLLLKCLSSIFKVSTVLLHYHVCCPRDRSNCLTDLCLVYTHKQLLLVGLTSGASVSNFFVDFLMFCEVFVFWMCLFLEWLFVMCLFFIGPVLVSVKVSCRQGSIYRGLMTTHRVY